MKLSSKSAELLGLNDTQLKIYRSFLQLGTTTAPAVMKKGGWDKTTMYRAIDALMEKGLLIKTSEKKGAPYSAVSPEIMKDLVKHKQLEVEVQAKQIDDYVDSLLKQVKAGTSPTGIRIEKGREAHRVMMESMLKSESKLVRQRLNTDAPIYDYPGYEEWVRDYIRRRIEAGVFFRQLINRNKSYYLDDVVYTGRKLMKEVRIMPWELPSSNSLKIFDDRTIITIHHPDPDEIKIITVTDPYVTGMMREMFDFIWERSAVFHGKQVLPQKKIMDGVTVPSLGIGTWGIGGYLWRSPYNDDINDVEQLKHSLGKGQTYLDVCLKYADGYAIDLVSKAIKNYPRDSLFINAKFTRRKDMVVDDPRDIEKQCDDYLKTFGTDHIDVFQIHSPRVMSFPIAEVVDRIDRLIKKGKVRALGVSNFTVPELKEAIEASKYGVVSNEIHYSLMHREHEEDGTIDFCEENDILVVAYRPINRGLLCGIELDEQPDKLMTELTDRYDKTSGQIAINWLVNKPNVMAITKSTNGSHINENVAALDWEMEERDYQRLDKWRAS